MAIEDQLFGIHGTALGLRSQRMSMLASNIANAATPNYKARDIDFQSALNRATESQSIDSSMEQSALYRIPLQASMDGNTVELPVEQTQFAENAIAYRTTLSFLEGRVGTIMKALRGE